MYLQVCCHGYLVTILNQDFFFPHGIYLLKKELKIVIVLSSCNDHKFGLNIFIPVKVKFMIKQNIQLKNDYTIISKGIQKKV